MNILVLGSGGREHAIAETISKSTHVSNLYVMPGNPGTANCAININDNPLDNEKVYSICQQYQIELVIPGSEVYLENGITDYLTSRNIEVFGPTKKAAQIETSKEFAKDLMKKYHIPTAEYKVFSTFDKAYKYLQEVGVPIVLKYDGLAGGKGVVVALDMQTAVEALEDMLVHQKYGSAKVVIEEYLEGPEFSLMCFVDNQIVIPMPIAQDHKRLLEHDLGPNTGGMGIYSGVPIIPEDVVQEALENIMKKTVHALHQEGIPYRGFLYGGLMWTKNGPKVIEFNARFGDPEAEVILPKLESDIIEIIQLLKQGKKPSITWNNLYYLGVVMATKGYPEQYLKGFEITGIQDIEPFVYHMGTKLVDNKLVTNGGRVLLVLGKGSTLEEAKNMAYHHISKIKCNQFIYRTDIGYRALKGT